MPRRLLVPAVFILVLLSHFTFTPKASAASFCDAAAFIMDVTVPDGTSFAAGTPFIKTWRLRNAGTCTWTKSYALVFSSGEQMGAPTVLNLPMDVPPGQVIDLSVQMTAPSNAGLYRGNWMFRNASGGLFGIGSSASSAFWVEIKVAATRIAAFDFAANVCAAEWYYDGGPIPCPKKPEKEELGYVVRVDNPTLENGTAAGMPGLLTVPQQKNNGVIKGIYPVFDVQAGDRFQAMIGCEYGATSCYVNFILETKYSGGGGTFWKFAERYDGRFYRADVDLTPLAGKKNLQLILTVSAAGSAAGDRALWVAPSIMRAYSVVLPTTAVPPPTGTATLTPTPQSGTPTATLPPASGCDKATFVADVTIPDGTSMSGGQTFTKTWRLKNAGTCTWTPAYSLVFVSGQQMGAPASIPFPNSVAPNQSTDLSASMTAPTTAGTYRGYWMLRNPAGGFFGIGSTANKPFWVEIVVPQGTISNGYDFAADVCSASWMSGAGVISCAGTEGDNRGFVIKKNTSILENGATDPRPSLLTFPQNVSFGWVQGIYPPYAVSAGDHFQSIINCEYQAADCNVFFRLDYQIDANPVQTLAAYNEAYEGQSHALDVDLTTLAGKQVKFILTVLSNGSPAGDRAVWVAPRVVPAAIPTATPVSPPATPIPPTATGGAPTATFTPVPPTATVTGWISYQNPGYKFQFLVPPGSVFASMSNTQARINLPFEAGTNLSEKYLEVLVAESLSPCSDTSAPPWGSVQNVTFNGIEFLEQTGSEGGVGHLHEWTSYSTQKGNACITLRFMLHSLNLGNYATPPPAFNREAETAVFTQIMNTFGWLP